MHIYTGPDAQRVAEEYTRVTGMGYIAGDTTVHGPLKAAHVLNALREVIDKVDSVYADSSEVVQVTTKEQQQWLLERIARGKYKGQWVDRYSGITMPNLEQLAKLLN